VERRQASAPASGGSAQAGLSVARPARRLRAGHETLRLSAFRFLLSFVARMKRSEIRELNRSVEAVPGLRSGPSGLRLRAV
jgi:hypothetical protein